MTRRKRSALFAGSLLAASCGSPSEHPPTTVAKPDAAAAATRALVGDAVFHDRFVRRTLYTWTTPEQLSELRTGTPLLSREESPVHGASYSDQVLEALAQRGDATAKMLFSTGFAKSRYAWPAPWATRAGWPDEQYGDQLIRITLRPGAVIVALSTATGTFEARDLDDKPVLLADLVANPARIAALYFTSDASRPPAAGIPKPTATFREYLVCNDAMIESWTVGGPELAREVEREAAALDALVAYLRGHAGPTRVVVPGSWARAQPVDTPEAAFAAALAFDNVNYRLDPDALALLAQLLRAAPKPPLFGGQGGTFAGIGSPRKTPRIVPAGGTGGVPTTYATTYAKPKSP